RPGGPHQRRPARRPGHRPDPRRIRPRRADRLGDRRRPGVAGPAGDPGCGPARHAGTGHRTGRRAARRPQRRRRLCCTGHLPTGGTGRPGVIRVLLADDQALMRAGFRALLDAEDDLEVVGEAADGASAVELSRRLRPDVVLMDVQMPGLNGIEATRRIAADPDLAAVRVLILTNYGLDSYVFAALRAGASGFLLKDAAPADLLQAVAVVARGDALLAPAVTRTLISEFVNGPPPADPAAGRDVLTARE